MYARMAPGSGIDALLNAAAIDDDDDEVETQSEISVESKDSRPRQKKRPISAIGPINKPPSAKKTKHTKKCAGIANINKANALYNQKKYADAFLYYCSANEALKNSAATEQKSMELEIRLGILFCKVNMYAIDIDQAFKEITQLSEQYARYLNKEAHTFIENFLTYYADNSNKANAYYFHANTLLANMVPNSVVAKMLGLGSTSTVIDKCNLLRNAYDKLNKAHTDRLSAASPDDIYNTTLTLTRLSEQIADFFYDTAEKATITQLKIDLFKHTVNFFLIASTHSANLYALIKNEKDPNVIAASLADLNTLQLSVLNTYEKLIELDPTNSREYATRMLDLTNKITAFTNDQNKEVELAGYIIKARKITKDANFAVGNATVTTTPGTMFARHQHNNHAPSSHSTNMKETPPRP